MATLAEQARALAERLRGMSETAETAVEKAIYKGALMIEADAKRNCPVKSGKLRNSIAAKFYKNGGSPYATVGTDVEYAPYVEFGTRFQKPQPYLGPAFNANAGRIREMIEEAVKGGGG